MRFSDSEINKTSLDRRTVTRVGRRLGTGARKEHRKKPDIDPEDAGRAWLSQSLQDSPKEGNQPKSVPTNENKGRRAKAIEQIFTSIKTMYIEMAGNGVEALGD